MILSRCYNKSSIICCAQKIVSIDQFSQNILSTSSLIRPSYTIRATIFEKVFRPKKFPKTEHFLTKRIISLSSRACKLSSRTCKLYFPPLLNRAIIVLVLFLAPIASLLHRDGKQARKSNKTERQTEHLLKGGSKNMLQKISSPTLKNAWRNIPFNKNLFCNPRSCDSCSQHEPQI